MESRLQSGSGSRERLVLKMNATHSSSLAAEVPAYAQLQREIHDALLAQHPDWILPNGDCPTCDSYDARFAELLMHIPSGSSRALKQGSIHQFQFEFQYPSRVITAHYTQ